MLLFLISCYLVDFDVLTNYFTLINFRYFPNPLFRIFAAKIGLLLIRFQKRNDFYSKFSVFFVFCCFFFWFLKREGRVFAPLQISLLFDNQFPVTGVLAVRGDSQRVDAGNLGGGNGMYRRVHRLYHHAKGVDDLNLHLADFLVR